MAATDLYIPVAHHPEDYDFLVHEATRIIDDLIRQSLAHIKETTDANVDERNTDRGRFIEFENEAKTPGHKSIRWPNIAEFTNEKVGVEKIAEYIENEWKTAPGGHDFCWLYAINFLERKSLEFNDIYIYQVRYSIPTRRQPIPRQTASIYFTIDVSKVKPKNLPVKVLFAFETMRIIHQPIAFRFRQNWLQDIILFKENMSNGINF